MEHAFYTDRMPSVLKLSCLVCIWPGEIGEKACSYGKKVVQGTEFTKKKLSLQIGTPKKTLNIMDRRHFIALSLTGLVELGIGTGLQPVFARRKGKDSYSIVVLGDTHFDAEPESVYHSDYLEPNERLNKIQRGEFARNGKMWRELCPRLVRRAHDLITPDTQMVFQLGDLIQGDCGNPSVHRRFLDDTVNYFKQQLGDVPFVSVVGNHDVRGTKAEAVYHEYMPGRMSKELGRNIYKTTFSVTIGKDAFLFVDFNRPDDAELERLLKETEGARYTFVVVHSPIIPHDGGSPRWFFHGSAKKADTEARRHFRRLFAQRNAMVLCGHTHTTEFIDWYGDGGRITQMTMNSVWTREDLRYCSPALQGPETYGEVCRKKMASAADYKEVMELFDEYRAGLRQYTVSPAAGVYKLSVSSAGVSIDFYGGDSERVTQTFVLR